MVDERGCGLALYWRRTGWPIGAVLVAYWRPFGARLSANPY